MGRVVHVLIGSSAAASFRQSKVAANRKDVLLLFDHLSCGPLPPISDVLSWTRARRKYWRSITDASYPGTTKDIYGDVSALQAAEGVVLWLGTELADQIAAAWLPAFLHALDGRQSEIKIVQFKHNVRDKEVLSLALLHPKDIAAHPPLVSLTVKTITELDAVWNAITSPDPTSLAAYLKKASHRFPLLARTLREGLARYPDATSGLSRWEAGLLRNVRRVQPSCTMVIGQTLADSYDSFWAGRGGRDQVGDAWLFDRILKLADPKLREPAIEITGSRSIYRKTKVRLTAFGQAILDGKANFVDANGIDEWVFGVHLQSAAGRVWFHRGGELVRR